MRREEASYEVVGAEGGGSGPGWGPIFLSQQQQPRWISCGPGSHYWSSYAEASPPPLGSPVKGAIVGLWAAAEHGGC